METFRFGEEEEEDGVWTRFRCFKKAAAKGHKDAIWIESVLANAEMNGTSVMEAFALTDTPLGWYFAGYLSSHNDQVDFYKKSAEGGCSWGQVGYGWYFQYGFDFEHHDTKTYLEWLEKAAKQSNPLAMEWLSGWLRGQEEESREKAVAYLVQSAELGWKRSPAVLAEMFATGEGSPADLRRGAIWSARGDALLVKDGFCSFFWEYVFDTISAFDHNRTYSFDVEFNQFCYLLGMGLYWHVYGSLSWSQRNARCKSFAGDLMNFYCSTVELQLAGIRTFLMHWNRETGVKDVGAMIGKRVWEEDLLVKLDRFWGEK
jgi:hypothetical protein